MREPYTQWWPTNINRHTGREIGDAQKQCQFEIIHFLPTLRRESLTFMWRGSEEGCTLNSLIRLLLLHTNHALRARLNPGWKWRHEEGTWWSALMWWRPKTCVWLAPVRSLELAVVTEEGSLQSLVTRTGRLRGCQHGAGRTNHLPMRSKDAVPHSACQDKYW